MYKWGKSSERRMRKVNETLVDCAYEALSMSNCDMTVPWMGGWRMAFEQNEIFRAGNSKVDGYEKLSAHQFGDALDVIPYLNGEGTYKAYDSSIHFAHIMLTVFNYNKLLGEIDDNVYLHWGGFWGAKDLNGDGILNDIDDKVGWDIAHFQLKGYPQKRVLTIY